MRDGCKQLTCKSLANIFSINNNNNPLVSSNRLRTIHCRHGHQSLHGKTPVTFHKKRPTADDFEAKIGLFGRQAAVHKPLSWSISTIFVGRPFIYESYGPSYKFSCVGGRLLKVKQSLSSPSRNPRGQVGMSVVGRTT